MAASAPAGKSVSHVNLNAYEPETASSLAYRSRSRRSPEHKERGVQKQQPPTPAALAESLSRDWRRDDVGGEGEATLG